MSTTSRGSGALGLLFATTLLFRGDGLPVDSRYLPIGEPIIGVPSVPGLPVRRFAAAMPVPPILEPTSRAGDSVAYDLRVQKGTSTFFPGISTDTFGYNGNLLGPTIRLRRGEEITIRVHNLLTAGRYPAYSTNIHWHGMRIPADADGPHHDIAAGGTFVSRFRVDQQAASLWYHPHGPASGFQVFWGLAGYLYIDDPIADALPIPHEYGVDDFPLIVQDRNFLSDGTLSYFMAGPKESVESRILGEYILVNGVINPYLDVPHGLTRLRLLNASDARRYRFAFEDGRSFHLIASDGGFLPAPVAATSVDLSPAERAEILVDFAQDNAGTRLKLVSKPFPVARDEHGPFLPPMLVAINGKVRPVVTATGQGNLFPVMELRVSGAGASRPLPSALVPIDRIPENESRVTRTFELERTGENTINGMKFDMGRIDAHIESGSTEVWSVTNYDSYFSHSFHVHGIQFNVIDRTRGGRALELAPLERGWKDTVVVHPEETVRIIGRFDGLSGMYMFHCHVLEHEDRGMMGTFLVTDSRASSSEKRSPAGRPN